MGRRNARAPSVHPRRPQLNQLANDAGKTRTNKDAPATRAQPTQLRPLQALFSPASAAALLGSALAVCVLIVAGEWALAAGLRWLFRVVLGSAVASSDLSLAMQELDVPELLFAAVALCRMALAAISAFAGAAVCATILIRREEASGRTVGSAFGPTVCLLLCIGGMHAVSPFLPALPAPMRLDLGWPSSVASPSFSALAFNVAYSSVIVVCVALSMSSSVEARRLERLEEEEQRKQKRE